MTTFEQKPRPGGEPVKDAVGDGPPLLGAQPVATGPLQHGDPTHTGLLSLQGDC